MTVVDKNLLVYMFFTGEHSGKVEEIYRLDSEWIAPLLWRSEFRNVLAHYLRKGLISLNQANLIMEQAELVMSGHEFEVKSYQVLDLLQNFSLPPYGCEYVALAKDLKIPLVTADQQILAQFPGTSISLKEFIGI